jgi:gamma-glutamyltranspeptidase/glutathione hydrolase
MCYFSLDPNDVNKIEGRERTRSTMCPTIVFRFDKPYFALGAAGGWTIPQTVLQTILNVIDFKLYIREASSGPRFIVRYLDNSVPYVQGTELSIDSGISADIRRELEALGHRLIMGGAGRSLNAILIDPKSGALWGAGQVATW